MRIKQRYFSSFDGRRQKSLILYHFCCFFNRKWFHFKSFPRAQSFPLRAASLKLRMCWWKRAEKLLTRVKSIFNDSSLTRLADFLRYSFSRVAAFLENRWNRFKLKASEFSQFDWEKVFCLLFERVPSVKWFYFSPPKKKTKFRGKKKHFCRALLFGFVSQRKLSWSEPNVK